MIIRKDANKLYSFGLPCRKTEDRN